MPHTPATEGFFDRARFQRMKRTAFFINIGRGMTTKLDDLVAALRAGEIAGAGLDVYETEPLPDAHPLWTMPNVLLTPHALCWTDECFDAIAREGLTCMVDVANGRRPKSGIRVA